MTEEKRIARLLLALSPGDGVLDVACGTGNFTREFARTVGPDGLVVGFDLSETMLTRGVRDTAAAGLGDRVAYVRGDATAPVWRDASFDAACCFAALHLMADPWDALDRMTAALTPGGRIAIFTSTRGRTLPLRAFEAVAQRTSGMRMFERYEVVGALEERGFAEIRQRVAGFTQFVGGRLAS
jgi:ubiquinone/menaquinone biosynthesis C-methylase UbiE